MTVILPSAVPEGFRDRFIIDGWRGIERYYGARTGLMLRWIDASGGLEVLQAERRAYRQAEAQRAHRSVASERDASVRTAA